MDQQKVMDSNSIHLTQTREEVRSQILTSLRESTNLNASQLQMTKMRDLKRMNSLMIKDKKFKNLSKKSTENVIIYCIKTAKLT